MTGVALDPEPLHVVRLGGGIQPGPQVGVLHRLLLPGLPAVALPPGQPLGDAPAQVDAVGVHVHAGRAGQALQGADGGRDLHPVVRGLWMAAVDLLLVTAVPQNGSPAARAGIGRTTAIREDLHERARWVSGPGLSWPGAGPGLAASRGRSIGYVGHARSPFRQSASVTPHARAPGGARTAWFSSVGPRNRRHPGTSGPAEPAAPPGTSGPAEPAAPPGAVPAGKSCRREPANLQTVDIL